MEYLGMLNFYKRFIPGAAAMLSPLYDATAGAASEGLTPARHRVDRDQTAGLPRVESPTRHSRAAGPFRAGRPTGPYHRRF